ncbi:hypothetical protein V5799_021917 [Amblyomma americanum]|uniref:Uncharacterized protein n=1 Tax=Amblyomma americanum TaxID=6943 RepID=A0AAQ4FM01_AMBAM
MTQMEGVVNRTSQAAAASPPQVAAANEGVAASIGDDRASPRVVQRDLFQALGRTKSALLVGFLVVAVIGAAALVIYATQRSIYGRIEEVRARVALMAMLSQAWASTDDVPTHQRVRQYIREVLGEPGHGRYPGAPIPRTPFIFSCQTDHCTKEGKHLRRNVAWSLDPCRDFHEYACSGDARRPSLREDALSHFLVEVRSVLGKWSQFRWTRTPLMHNKASQFFRACHGSRHDEDTLQHDLGQYLRDVDKAHRLPEAWAAEVSRTLQLFPLFEVSVFHLTDDTCIVLKEPEVVDGDAVLGMPGVASRRHRSIVEKLWCSANKLEKAGAIFLSQSKLRLQCKRVTNWLKHVVGSGGRVFDTNLELVCHFEPETKTLGIPMSIADVDVGGREFFLDISTVGLLMARSLYRIFQASSLPYITVGLFTTFTRLCFFFLIFTTM